MIALLFWIVIVLVVAGFLSWLVGKIPFIPAGIRPIVQGTIVFVALLIVLYAGYHFFASGGGLNELRPPHK